MLSATKCSDQIKDLLNAIPILKDKVVTANSADALVEKLKLVKKPAVGILYEGAKRAPGTGGAQLGLSAEVVFSLMLVHEVNVIAPNKVDNNVEVHEILDDMRKALSGVRAPTGHFWSWQVEAPVQTKAAMSLWGQRWTANSNHSPSKPVG